MLGFLVSDKVFRFVFIIWFMFPTLIFGYFISQHIFDVVKKKVKKKYVKK